jgi:hypothetical protein
MVQPKTLMAHVLIFISVIVQAQSLPDNSILCYIGADNAPHKITANVAQQVPYSITCKYEDGTVAIPKFFQFSCDGGSTSLTVKVNITDGEHTQVISKDISVNENDVLYEVPVLAMVNDAVIQSGKARIKSITFVNNMNVPVLVTEVNFSNTSLKYEVKMNQVFTVDLRTAILKKYFITAETYKTISINLYKPDGEFDQKIAKGLVRGENYLDLDQLGVKEGKYVVVITENDLKKAPSSRITVMN